MTAWRLHHRAETASTNLDAEAGVHGDVFTADYQTAGRGRLDHKWLSPPGTNLMMSAVLSVEGLSPESVSTLPLVVGLSVAEGLSPWISGGLSPRNGGLSPRNAVRVKWPNDVLVGGRKVSGILCVRHGDAVIAGIGVNVAQTEFPAEIAERATSLSIVSGYELSAEAIPVVREAVLAALGRNYETWRRDGFSALHPHLAAIDFLRGQSLSVWQTDDDNEPISGVCGGINADGTLDVGGTKVYAGEAHVGCDFSHSRVTAKWNGCHKEKSHPYSAESIRRY